MRSPIVLQEAMRLMATSRQEKYGDFGDNHRHIAALWNAYLGTQFTADQCAVMMALVKVARTTTSPQEPDHYIDACAYLAGAASIATEGYKK